MRFAYADPPYPGMAHFYPENIEVDHADLIRQLCHDFPDGWALSTASVTLQEVLSLCPSDVRIMSWVKTFASFKPGVNPAYAWEPVIVRGGRTWAQRGGASAPTVRDWHACPITIKKGLVGAKPQRFCQWILLVLGYQDGDTIVDIFPGTGIMSVTANQGILI